ncbi:bifunctional diguanylate cyclase/phosphodiesterase [Pseudorhodoferax sp.]|uniref:bifunctional diguanylate cyclase/phosphodiesterase n=1 Tax=Pseudorhodoferax sp. TaxID=1993553 RepID=UPI002DD61949|nr:EAL domain-containing protein [Pseudorhodoferax sp.]
MTRPSPSVPDPRPIPPGREAGARRSAWSRPGLAAGLTSLALAVVPLVYWQHRQRDAERQLNDIVAHESDAAVANVQAQLRAFELVLRGVKGFFEGSDQVSAAEFKAFVESLALQRTAPGLQGIGFVAHLSSGTDTRHAAAAAFAESGLVLRPAGARASYAPIVFMEPPTRNNQSALGLDVLTVPVARQAVEQTLATGALALTSKLQLAQDAGGAPVAGFVMYLPIYLPQGQEGSGAAPAGWADAPFRLRELLAPAAELMPGLRLQVFDGDSPSEASHLFGLLDGQAVAFTDTAPSTHAARRVSAFGGRNWTYLVEPTGEFFELHRTRDHHALAAAGVLFSLSAGAVVFLLLSARNRAQQLALDMSREARALSAEIAGTLNAIPDLLVEMDDEGRYLALRARRLDGLIAPPEQLIGRTVREVLPPAAAETVLQALAQARAEGRAAGHRIEVGIGGQTRWFELSVARKDDQPQGAAPRFIVLSRDISSRMRALQALQESERVLLEAQRVAALGHFWVDRQTRACRLSLACARLLGLPPVEVQGFDAFLGCVDARQRARVEALCLADAAPVEYEFRIERADDAQPRWMLLSAPGASAVAGERFFTLQDISSRRASQDQLKLLHSAVESLNDAVLITEAEPLEEPGPRIVFVNEAFVRRTGYSRAEVLGRSPRFLQGPQTPHAELARIAAAVRRGELVRSELVHTTGQGQPTWLELVVQPIADENGWTTHWVAVARDIGERREAEAQVHQLAYFDQLTGLPNRSLFVREATQVLESAQVRGGVGAAILMDLDKFKTINDNWGHRCGDAMLRVVAQRLRGCVPPEHLVARLHADEFIVLLRDLGDDEEEAARAAQDQCRTLQRVLAASAQIGGREHYTSASMGIAVFGPEQLTLDELLARADSAMELAKHDGRNTFRFFDEGLRSRLAERALLEAALRQAVPRNELTLLYQPQIDARGALVGAEALCRWTHPERGPVSPAVFIALAEDNGSIYALGEWVLRSACRTLASWDGGTPLGTAVMAVNVSARQFHHPDFVSQVLDALQSAGAEPTRLKLELTESVVARDLDAIVTKMGALKALGVRFSLDDFGTGYSSLSYLKRLPLDQLKIDQSFVRDLLDDANDAAIVRTVIALGASLGLSVVAEGVETAEQRAVLLAAGCSIFQGYLFARPLAADALLALAADAAAVLR